MSVTIYEIAKRARVSSSTVARVLRGEVRESQQRSSETARRVRAIAKEMGYRPNLRARAFSRRCTHGIGLFYSDEASVFAGENASICNTLVRALQRDGFHLVFVPLHDAEVDVDAVVGGQLDGGIVMYALPEVLREVVRERKLPLVMLGDTSEPGLSHVFVDNYAGGYIAAKHLIGLGHDDILFYVHVSASFHFIVEERLRGYRAAMAEAGLDLHECIRVTEGDVLSELVQRDRKKTGVICSSEVESILLTHGLWLCGLSVPHDVSVIGFNDVFATRFLTPPLTTIGCDAEKVGETCAQLILGQIAAWPEAQEPTILGLKPNLIVRGSTASPRTSTTE